MGTSFSPRHIRLSDNFVVRRPPLSASPGHESSSFVNSFSFLNSSIIEQQRKHTAGQRSARKRNIDWEPVHQKRCPLQQEKYTVGKYPAVCLNKSPIPSVKLFGERDGTTGVKVKILPLSTSPKQRVTLSPQSVESSTEANKQDPCSTEAVLKALKERRKRAAMPGQDDADKGEASKRQRKDNAISPTSALPISTYCPTAMPIFGGTVRSRVSEKRPHNSVHESPGDGSKRIRNNAIFSSFCSSRNLLESGQAQKRKAPTCESSPQMKITKKDDRGMSSCAGDHEAKAVIKEKAAETPTQEQKNEVTVTLTSETTQQNTSSLKREFFPSDQSVRKKKLLFPEHIATVQEHEQDSLLEKQRLNLMLGSISDLYKSTKPANTSSPQIAATTSAVTSATTAAFQLPPQHKPAVSTGTTLNIMSTSTNVTQAVKTPAVTFGLSTGMLTGSQQFAGAQLPGVNTSTSHLTTLKTPPPVTTTTESFVLQQLQSGKSQVTVSTSQDKTFVVSTTNTTTGQSLAAVTSKTPQQPAFTFTPKTVISVSTSSGSGPPSQMPGLSLPLTFPATGAAPLEKTVSTSTTTSGEPLKSTPFVFGSTPSSRSPFTFSAGAAVGSQPSIAPASQGVNTLPAEEAPNPASTQAQRFVLSTPSKTLVSSSIVNFTAVNSSAKSSSQQIPAGSFFAPALSVSAISQASPMTVPSKTQSAVKFAPASLGGFSFPTTPVVNGVNGVGPSTAPPMPAFKFGMGNSGDAPLNATFNFSAQQNSVQFSPKQNAVLGSNPGIPAGNSLFSIGTGARSERPIAVARSRRTTRK